MDIAFLNEMYYIEYNGGGHYSWPKYHGKTDKDVLKSEMIRYQYSKRVGWKLITIICKSDKLLEDDLIINLINECREYLFNQNHSWVEINFDTRIIKGNKYYRVF